MLRTAPACILAVRMLFFMSEGLASVVQELDAFLMGESKVQRTLEGIAARLGELDARSSS